MKKFIEKYNTSLKQAQWFGSIALGFIIVTYTHIPFLIPPQIEEDLYEKIY